MTDHPFTPEKIRALRETAGLSLEQAAARVGVTGSTWWRWEQGRITPTSWDAISALQNFAKFCSEKRS